MGFGEVAAVVAFLFPDGAAIVNGATPRVGSGRAMRGHDLEEPADGT
jgi:hypothetical protein